MKTKHYIEIVFLSIIGSFLNLNTVYASHSSRLIQEYDEIIKKIDSGVSNRDQSVCRENQRVNKGWPEMICYSWLDKVSPFEAVSFFYDLEYQRHYIPDMKESVVIAAKRANELEAYYRFKMPWPLSDMQQVTHNKFISYDKSRFGVTWGQVSSNFTDDVKGEALFTEYQGKTLFIYSSHIIPKFSFAKLFERKALENIKLTYNRIKEKINKAKRVNRVLINAQVKRLQSIIKGKNIYQDIINKRSGHKIKGQ